MVFQIGGNITSIMSLDVKKVSNSNISNVTEKKYRTTFDCFLKLSIVGLNEQHFQ